MISQIASIVIIGAAVILIHDDPLHKFHHATPVKVAVVAPVKAVKIASIQPIPAKHNTAADMRRALNESNLILDRMEKKVGWQ